ncbi:MAG: metallophosphoesterase [Desulfobacterales bacterium]|nr:metallophosphoesterase [Desulfobacterales bacterium]
MILFLLSLFSVCILVLFTGIILFREYQIETILHVGWGGVYFGALIMLWLGARRSARGLVSWVRKRAGRLAEGGKSADTLRLKWGKITAMDPGRRRFLSNSVNAGVVALSGAFVGGGLVNGSLSPAVRETIIPAPNLPDDLDGFRIVQISDTHVNDLVTRDWVRDVVDKINSLNPDIVVHTGDLADEVVSIARDTVAPLADISSKFGRYFVTGNHEYLFMAGRVEDWLEELDKLGFVVLSNEHVVIQRGEGRILLGGVIDPRASEDRRDRVSDPFAAMAGAEPCDYKILLSHRPGGVYQAAEAGFDLQLSGHTHGGQFFPLQYIAPLFTPYVSGLYRYKNTRLFVNQGTGYYGPPIRHGVPAEISLLKLKKDSC